MINFVEGKTSLKGKNILFLRAERFKKYKTGFLILLESSSLLDNTLNKKVQFMPLVLLSQAECAHVLFHEV